MNYTELYLTSENAGFMPASLFYLLLIISIAFLLYGFYLTDRNNYTHIILSMASAIMFILCGYNSYLGIGYLYPISTEVQTYYYQSAHIAGLLIIFGIFMMIYSIVRIIDVAKEEAEENGL